MSSRSAPIEVPDGSLLPAQVAVGGALLADMLAGRASGLRRRVETVSFEEDRAKRTLTIDVDVQGSEHQVPLPLALFGKHETVAAANVRDEEGRVLPMLTQGEASAVGYVALRLAAAEADLELTFDEERLLLELATAPTESADVAYLKLCELRPAWREDAQLAGPAKLLAGHVLLIGLVRSAGGRRTVTLSWEELVSGGRPRTVWAGLFGRSGSFAMLVRGLPAASGAHLEVHAPEGTEITGFRLVGRSETLDGRAGVGGSRLWVHAPPEQLLLGEVLLVSVRAAGPLLKVAALATTATLLVLLIAFAVPSVRHSDALLLGLLAAPVLMVLGTLGALRARDTGFGAVFAFGPLLVSLLPALAVGALALAGVARDSEALSAVAAVCGGLVAVLVTGLASDYRDQPDDQIAWEMSDGQS